MRADVRFIEQNFLLQIFLRFQQLSTIINPERHRTERVLSHSSARQDSHTDVQSENTERREGTGYTEVLSHNTNMWPAECLKSHNT